MIYLAVNTRQDPRRGGIINESNRVARTRLESILSQQPDATPKHVKNLGYVGRRFGTSQNWGARLKDRQAARARLGKIARSDRLRITPRFFLLNK